MLCQLAVRNFRNLDTLSWDLGPGSHLLLGGTGAGKTSLLEAAYVAATTRSFRTSQLEDLVHVSVRDSGAGMSVRAEAEGPRRVSLEVGWSPGAGVSRAVNGADVPLAEHLEALPVLAWTARDGDTLTGAPEWRRRWMDRGVVSSKPATLATLARYRRILRQKRELLWRRQDGLESWNELMAPAIVEVVSLRRNYVVRVQEALSLVVAASGLDYPPVELEYEPSPATTEDAGSASDALAAAAASEREQRRALVGPHRDRLALRWGGTELRRVASAGERKALGLLLVAAQTMVLEAAGRPPTVLIDDADVELDQPTLKALWQVLQAGPGAHQSLVTSNRPEVWEGLETGARWQVRGGRLMAMPSAG